MRACVRACVHVCMCACVCACLPACMYACIHGYLPYILACVYIYIHMYLDTCTRKHTKCISAQINLHLSLSLSVYLYVYTVGTVSTVGQMGIWGFRVLPSGNPQVPWAYPRKQKFSNQLGCTIQGNLEQTSKPGHGNGHGHGDPGSLFYGNNSDS